MILSFYLKHFILVSINAVFAICLLFGKCRRHSFMKKNKIETFQGLDSNRNVLSYIGLSLKKIFPRVKR